ncbi:MAG: tyrosine-type recombinase/integrase [Chitinophagales bacterium]|nr:tyrosine-type recombinase/integrase [Chitinophagales bacterium]MDW8394416.1 tyrosine-type recombinase/integrase [Chitinophagales bacterium]
MELQSFFNYLQFEKRCSAHTLTAYRNDLRQFSDYLRRVYDVTDVSAVEVKHIRSWMVHLFNQRIGGRSMNRKLSCLSSYFRFMQRSGKVKQSPMTPVTGPRAPQRLPVFIPSDQMESLFASVNFGSGFSGMRNRMLLELLYATGMRRSELIALQDSSVDFRRNTIRVLGKGGKERLVPFGDSLKELLQKYLDERNRHFGKEQFPALVVSDSGKQMNPRSVYNCVRRLLDQVTFVSRRSPHVLRHTFATHLLNNGAEIQAIKELLGHASLAATQVYTHNSVEQLKAVYRKAHPKA